MSIVKLFKLLFYSLEWLVFYLERRQIFFLNLFYLKRNDEEI